MNKFRGVYAVTLTPFNRDESVDEDGVREHANWLVEQGVHGIICTGSTGEAASLSEQERKRVVEITIDAVRRRVPVLVGSGANSTRDTIMYSRHAEEAGADGLMVIHPFYCMPNERELFEHYKRLARSVLIPIMIYNNPVTSGIDMKPELLARFAEFENIQYIKDATDDIKRVGQVKRLCGDRISFFVGCDNIMFECWLMGAEGWVSGMANILPRQCVKLWNLTIQGEIDKARKLYYRMLPLGDMLDSEGLFIQYLKAGSELLGRPLGKPRRPLLPPTTKDVQRLKAALDLAAS
jgi:4-hydroxy-tetrahydrodipicolinate synthase